VVVPTYNGSRYISTALESIASELTGDVEVIAVDDCSTDATLGLLKDAARRIPLQIVRNERRLGWVAATNVGFRLARGDWLCTLHQDDVWATGHLNALREANRSSQEAGLIVGASVFIDDLGRPLGRWRLPWRGASPDREEVARRLYVQNFLAIPATCIRADTLRKVGVLDEQLWYTADWDLWLRLARVTPVVTARGPLAGFRVHALSQTISGSLDIASFERQLRVVQERHRWAAGEDRGVLAAGEAATRTNVALATMMHGARPNLGSLAAIAITMPPAGWVRYFRDSRIIDRALPRVRLRLKPQQRD
jgi:cellulose synthase/poly-beta-1,6-N-acetylglucosamine synthase-like glycosyltransferase